ncbi:hypothetical protein B0H10DRAFT_2047697 [Mycena sp. CBHHK59/15]|nr:hypothetical protein B0H10DRAFT_2047697 [Mycena sp. CBHHK59/15]
MRILLTVPSPRELTLNLLLLLFGALERNKVYPELQRQLLPHAGSKIESRPSPQLGDTRHSQASIRFRCHTKLCAVQTQFTGPGQCFPSQIRLDL